MNKNTVITNIEQLTPEWLTSIFRNKGYLSQGQVTKINKKKSQETNSSFVHFLEINFSADAQMEPSSLEIVVKIPKLTYLPNYFVGKHEVKFYNIVAEFMKEIPIPMCYNAAYSKETGLSHIILKSLSDTYTTWLDEYPRAQRLYWIKMAIDSLAEFHAFWWDHPKLKELSKHSFILYTFKENSFNEKEISSWFKSENQTLNRMLKLSGDQISDKQKELFKTVFSIFPEVAYERMKQGNITVLNGDAHQWNYFYPKDIENEKFKAILSDWDFWSIGVGGQDLTLMIGFMWPPEVRHELEKDLIKRYHNNLIDLGVKNYSWDEFWYDYKLLAFLNLYKVVNYWERDHPHMWFALKNSFAAIEDLNCMELLENK
jgi:hypothetical protein